LNYVVGGGDYGAVAVFGGSAVLAFVTGRIQKGERPSEDDVMTTEAMLMMPDESKGHPVVLNHMFRTSGSSGLNDPARTHAEDVAAEYFRRFDSTVGEDRMRTIGSLYSDDVTLCIDATPYEGDAAAFKLAHFPRTAHEINTLDAQPVPGADEASIIFVRGRTSIDDGHPLYFAHVLLVIKGVIQVDMLIFQYS
jgi:hypothetical protein